MKRGVILYGGGGHAKVVADCLKATGVSVIGFVDDNPLARLFDFSYLGHYRSDIFSNEQVVVAIGNNYTRKKLSEKVKHSFCNVIHPSALISESSKMGIGCMFLQGTIIQSDSVFGDHVIVNTAAQVDHDGLIGSFVHLGPGAVVCGNVTVGEGTLIGAGAVILPGTTIGKWATIAAGSVVTKDVADHAVVMGVPASVQ